MYFTSGFTSFLYQCDKFPFFVQQWGLTVPVSLLRKMRPEDRQTWTGFFAHGRAWRIPNNKKFGVAQSVQWLGYWLEDQGSIPNKGRDFPTAFTLALGPTQTLIRWVPEGERSEREANHLPAFSAEVKMHWSQPPLSNMWCSSQHKYKFMYIMVVRSNTFSPKNTPSKGVASLW
jgi:hypothetical protein